MKINRYLIKKQQVRLHGLAMLIVMVSFFTGCPGAGDDVVEVEKNPACIFGETDLDCIALVDFQPNGESNDLECQENEQNITQVCGDIIVIELRVGDGDSPLSDFLATGKLVPAKVIDGQYWPLWADSEELL